MRFLILGTLLSPTAFAYNQAANPASTKWLNGFAQGLAENGAPVSLCGHCYAQVWPKGPLLPGDKSFLEDAYPNVLVRFVNLPGIRFSSLASGYTSAADGVLRQGLFDAILTYNPYPWHVAPARKLREKFNIPWICLNLDFDDVGGRWEQFIRQAGDADGHLFLSHWGNENAPVEWKIHLDSGVDKLPENFGCRASEEVTNVVYLGKLSRSGGLETLLALPELLHDRSIRFIYGGKGYPEDVAKLAILAERDSRVEFLGFVEDRQVEGLFERADVFINPRDPEDVANDMVFPSKIMHYLQTGKTVVSTWTKGLEPVYRELMVIADSPGKKDFAAATARAVNESQVERAERSSRIRAFLEGSRLWSLQAKRFNEFAVDVCEDFRGSSER